MQQSLKSSNTIKTTSKISDANARKVDIGHVACALETAIADAIQKNHNSQKMVHDGTIDKQTPKQKALEVKSVYPPHSVFGRMTPHSKLAQKHMQDNLDTPTSFRPSRANEIIPNVEVKSGREMRETTHLAQSMSVPKEPANDDQGFPAVSTFSHFSSRFSFSMASLATLIWLACGLTYVWGTYQSVPIGQAGIDSSELILLVLAVFMPILSFFTIYTVVSRAKEMRFMAASIIQAANNLAKPETIAKDTVASVGQAVRREVAAMSESIERAVTRTNKLASIVHKEISSLEHAYDANGMRFHRLIEGLSTERKSIVSSTRQVSEEVSQINKSFNSDLLGITTRIAETVAAADGQINGFVEKNISKIMSELTTVSDNIMDKMSDSGNCITRNLLVASKKIESNMANCSDEFIIKLNNEVSKIDNVISSQNNVLSRHTDSFMQDFRLQASELDQGLEKQSQLSSKCVEQLGNQMQEFSKTISLQATDLDATLQRQGAAASTLLSSQLNNLSEIFTSQLHLLEIVDEKINPLNQNLMESIQSVNDILDNKMCKLIEKINYSSNQFSETINTNEDNISNWAKSKMEGIEVLISKRSNYLVSQAVMAAENIDEILKTRTDAIINDVQANINDNIENLDNQVALRVDKTMEKFTNCGNNVIHTIDERGKIVFDKFEQVGEALCQDFDRRNENMAQKLVDKGLEITNILIHSANTAANELSSYEDRVITSMKQTGSNIDAGLSGLLNRVEDANKNLQNTVSSAGNNVIAIGGELGKYTDILQDIIHTVTVKAYPMISEQLASQVSSLQHVSEVTLRDISSFASLFEQQGQLLSKTVNIVGEMEREMGDKFQKHAENITQMTTVLAQKSNDVSSLMHNFTTTIGDSFAMAEMQTDKITISLHDSVGKSSKAIVQECEEIVMSTEKSVGNLGDSMSLRCNQITSDMQVVLSNMQIRFEEISNQVQQTSGVLLSDIEHIRDDLKSGLVDLPNDTKEATNTMCRMIGNQVEALDELSKIISQHGKKHNITDANMITQNAYSSVPSEKKEYSAKTRVVQDSAPYLHRHAVDSFAQDADQSQQCEDRGGSISIGQERNGTDRGFDFTSRTSVKSDMPPATWSLSELLAKVRDSEKSGKDIVAPIPMSSKTQNKMNGADYSSPQQITNSLSSLSIEMARNIDTIHIDLWKRYKNGERSVFNGLLYNLYNQPIFENIKTKYQTDSGFQKTVDRYVNDFEMLVANTLQNDTSCTGAQTYLSSDTGKIYLMLACASGMFS